LKKIIFLMTAIFFLAGCARIVTETAGKWDEKYLLLIEKGKTTAKDIVTAFGIPQKEIIGSNGRIWIYQNISNQFLLISGNPPATMETESFCLTLWFNNEGIVVDRNLAYSRLINRYVKEHAERLGAKEEVSK